MEATIRIFLVTPLGYSYTKIYAESFEEARNTMFSLCGDKWVFQYEEGEDFGKGRFGLKEVYPEGVYIDSQSEDNDVD